MNFNFLKILLSYHKIDEGFLKYNKDNHVVISAKLKIKKKT